MTTIRAEVIGALVAVSKAEGRIHRTVVGYLSLLARMLGHADPGTTTRRYAVFRASELHYFHQRHSPVGRLKVTKG